jgi:hypothetical protein
MWSKVGMGVALQHRQHSTSIKLPLCQNQQNTKMNHVHTVMVVDWMKAVIVIAVMLLSTRTQIFAQTVKNTVNLSNVTNAKVQEYASPTNYPTIARAVWLVEGADKTRFPYGISRYGHLTKEQARQVCISTLRHIYERWTTTSETTDFYTYLSRRYDPANSLVWRKNLMYVLNHQRHDEQ